MDRINGAGHIGNRFVAEDLATNRPPTEITPEWMNSVQEELVAIATMNGAPLNPAVLTQARDAIVAYLQGRIDALVNASPAALDTLKELADAMGDDPNFATTVLNALALKAPLASPALTGTPTAPTPAIFDNSNKLVTTAFLALNAAKWAGYTSIFAGATLDGASYAGKVIQLSNTGYTVVLPLVAEVANGTKMLFINSGTGTVTITRQGADQIYPNLTTPVNSITLNVGDSAELMVGGGSWNMTAGSLVLSYAPQFGASLTGDGYQRLPSGLIVQWGNCTNSSVSGAVTTTFPIAFPNACHIVLPVSASVGTANFATCESRTVTHFTSSLWGVGGSRVAGYPAFFLAIGQ